MHFTRMILSRANTTAWLALAAFAALLLAVGVACSSDPTPTPTQAPLPTATPTATPVPADPVLVVTTSNIVGDWVAQIGGDRVELKSLLGPGVDPHSFQPTARDVAAIADASLVFAVGLSLEEAWLHELITNASPDPSAVVELGEFVDPIEFVDTHAGESELLEAMAELVHKAEDGEITAEAALEAVKELAESGHDDHGHEEDDHGHMEEDDHGHMEEDDHGHGEEDDHGHEEEDDHGHEEEDDHGHMEEGHHDEMDPHEAVLEILEHYEHGEISAEEALEQIEAALEAGHEEDDHGHMEEDDHGHGHGLYDPHFWFDPLRVKIAVDEIASRLAAVDPAGAGDYSANADAFKHELDDLHAWTQEQVATVPPEQRLLVTSHDAFGYFTALYGFELIGAVIPSFSTEVDPSAEDLADLVADVEKYGVRAVFGETTVSERLAAAVAAEAGVQLVRLYSGSLGEEGSGADTHVGMVRANVERIVGALR